ncbi:MAG: ankyrin repeat domain-containing protein [Betaproteobacteria bacterium]
MAAVRAGNLVKLRDLLDNHGANLNSRNRIGESLLMMSIKAGKQDIANYLLDRGARVDIASTANVTPLMAAAFNGDLGMVERLLERGADVHARDRLKKTAMVYAAGEGRTEVVARFLKAGVDINARYPNDLTALMWAADQVMRQQSSCCWMRVPTPSLPITAARRHWISRMRQSISTQKIV